MTLLDVSKLRVSGPDGRDLVSDVSFAIEPGARFGLIGESGSGKSLTALAIMGLLPAGMTAHGSVVLDAPGLARTEIVGATERQLNTLRGRAATVVFQEPLTALDPLMRIGRQIAEPIRRWRVSRVSRDDAPGGHRGGGLDGPRGGGVRGLRGGALRRAVLAALEEVRLDEPERIARAYPHEISGGQRQRVAIAMALACEPALLIADEPTTALDVTVQAEVLALLDGLIAAKGMALLFISHDLAVVSRVADRVLVLKDGRAVESGTVREIVSEPTHPYTRSLVSSARELDSALDWTTR